MFYDFIYLAMGLRMRPKVRSTLNKNFLLWNEKAHCSFKTFTVAPMFDQA